MILNTSAEFIVVFPHKSSKQLAYWVLLSGCFKREEKVRESISIPSFLTTSALMQVELRPTTIIAN